MHRTSRAAVLLSLVLLAVPAAAWAQDPEPPPPEDPGPLVAKLAVQRAAKKAALKRGVTVRVTCDRACDARLMLIAPVGIIAEKRAALEAGEKARIVVKVAPIYLEVLKPRQTLRLTLRARATDDGAIAAGRRNIRVR